MVGNVRGSYRMGGGIVGQVKGGVEDGLVDSIRIWLGEIVYRMGFVIRMQRV